MSDAVLDDARPVRNGRSGADTATADATTAPTAAVGRPAGCAPGFLAGAFVVALAVPRLGRRPVWLDEAFTVGATGDLVATWRGTGGTMALYYLLVWPVAQLSTERVWIRLPSVLFAAAAVVVVHEVGRLVGGRRMAAASAGTLALTWAVSRFAIEARAYTLALLLVSLAWLGLVGAVRHGDAPDRRRRWWRVFVVASLLAPLAHGLAALHFAGQIAALAVAPDRRRWLRAAAGVGVGLVVEGLLLFALGAGEVAAWIDPLHRRQVGAIVTMLSGRGPALWVVGPLAVAGACRVVARHRSSRDLATWLRVVPVFWAATVPLLVVAISVVRPYAEARYVIGAVPGVALLVGGLVADVSSTRRALAAWVVVAASLLPGQARVTGSVTEDWPALVDHVAARAEDGDRLLMPALLRAPFDHAWAEDRARPRLEPLSPTDPIGETRRFYDAGPRGLRAVLLDDTTTTVWYVDRDDERLDDVEALLADPQVAARYETAGPWVFARDLYLVRFEPRPSS